MDLPATLEEGIIKPTDNTKRANWLHKQLARLIWTIHLLLPNRFHNEGGISLIPYNTNAAHYSHSIVAGGLLVMSYTTRVMAGTSDAMRCATRLNRLWGSGTYSHVI